MDEDVYIILPAEIEEHLIPPSTRTAAMDRPSPAARQAMSVPQYTFRAASRSASTIRMLESCAAGRRCGADGRAVSVFGRSYGASTRRVRVCRANHCAKEAGSGWGRERVPLLRLWRSRCRDTHGNPKRLTLQPHTLNPSYVVVFSRRRREGPGGATHRPNALMH